MENKSQNLLLIITFVILGIAVFNFALTMKKVGDFERLTGFATDTANASVYIESQASIRFILSEVNFGSGSVVNGSDNATLNTEGVNTSWTGENYTGLPLEVENIGNVNVTLYFSANNTPAQFLGSGSPEYQIKVSNNESEPGSCVVAIGNFSDYGDLTTSNQLACSNFGFDPDRNQLLIDIQLVIPAGAEPGNKTSTITAEAFSIV